MSFDFANKRHEPHLSPDHFDLHHLAYAVELILAFRQLNPEIVQDSTGRSDQFEALIGVLQVVNQDYEAELSFEMIDPIISLLFPNENVKAIRHETLARTPHGSLEKWWRRFRL